MSVSRTAFISFRETDTAWIVKLYCDRRCECVFDYGRGEMLMFSPSNEGMGAMGVPKECGGGSVE